VAEYVAARHPERPDWEVLAQALHARTDALPLFLANVVDEFIKRAPDTVERAGASNGAWPVPESLAGVIERQSERLSAEERELLTVASVCGVEFDIATLADVMQRDPSELGPVATSSRGAGNG
jgi:predicted ATPase